MFLRMTITAQQLKIVKVKSDRRIRDIICGQVYLVVDCIAMPDDAIGITSLAQPADRLDIRLPDTVPGSRFIEITRKIPRQAIHPDKKIGMKKGAVADSFAYFFKCIIPQNLT